MSLKNNKLRKFFTPHSICLSIIFLIEIPLQFNPLTSSFSFEFSVVNSVLLFLLCGIFALKYSIKIKVLFQKNFLLFILAVFILPVLVSFLNVEFSGACPFTQGFSFYLPIVFPALLLGVAVAVFSNSLFNGYGKYLFFFSVFLIFVLENLIEFYFYPQIYFFNQIILFWPGTIYDDLIEPNVFWLTFRIITILFVALFLFLAKSKLGKWKMVFITFSVYFIFLFLKPQMGFATNMGKIRSKTETKLNTEHFNVFLFKNISDHEQKYLKGLLEFFYDEEEKDLKIKPDSKIEVIIFKNSEQKRRLFGSGRADVTKIWLSQIYLDYSSYEVNLKHELAHVFSKAIGNTLLKLPAKFNIALLEGFATAEANNYDDFNVFYPVKIFNSPNPLNEVKEIFQNVGFYGLNSSISYSFAGSFLKFLWQKYGIEKVKRVYSTGNFEKVFSKDFNELTSEYAEYLSTFKVAGNPFRKQLYFGRKPLIKKYCVRTAAKMREQAKGYFKKGNFKKAEEIYSELFYKIGEPKDLIAFVETEIKLNRLKTARTILDKNIEKFNSSPYYFQLIMLEAKVNNILKDSELALKYLNKLITMNPHPFYVMWAKAQIEKIKLNVDLDSLNEKQRVALLKELVFSKKRFNLAPVLLSEIQENHSEISDFITKFVSNIKIADKFDVYFLLKLVRLSEKNLLLNEAGILINKAIELNKNCFRSSVLEEEKQKISFLKNYLNLNGTNYEKN